MNLQTIEENTLLIVVVEIEVDPSHQEELAFALAENVDRYLKEYEGFVSAAFHISDDGLRVINYAKWRSESDWEKFRLSNDKGQLEREGILARCGAKGIGARSYRVIRVVNGHE